MCLVKNGTFLALCRVFYLIEFCAGISGRNAFWRDNNVKPLWCKSQGI